MYIPRHQKTYLSRAMTRAMAHDHPIGDPYGGPAYGERNDPVSAVISIGTLFASGGAVLAGTATLMQGLMFAGAALSLVGNVTGNKTLSRIGMVAGLAGGIGALAESAGMFGANAAEAAGGAAGMDLGFEDLGALGQTPTAQVPEALNMVDDVIVNPVANQPALATEPLQNLSANFDPGAIQVVDGPAPLINSAAPGLQSPSAASMPLGFDDIGALSGAPAAPGAVAPTAPGAPGLMETTGAVPPPRPAVDPFTGRTATGLATLPGDSQALAGPGFVDSLKAGNLMDAAKTAGSGLMDLAKYNPGAAYMLGSGVSSVADVLSGKTSAQIDALEAQGELSKAQADKLRYEVELAKQRRANLNASYAKVQNPLATWTPNFQVTPAAQSGLITGAMAPTPGG